MQLICRAMPMLWLKNCPVDHACRMVPMWTVQVVEGADLFLKALAEAVCESALLLLNFDVEIVNSH